MIYLDEFQKLLDVDLTRTTKATSVLVSPLRPGSRPVDEESAGCYDLRCKKRNDGGGSRRRNGARILHCFTANAPYRRARHDRPRYDTIARST